MQTKTIFAMPNPYAALDAKGRLAGCCQMAGALRGGPSVGAKLVLVDGTFDDRQAELGRALDEGKMATPVIPTILFSRGELFWEFSSEPVQLETSAEVGAFYEARFKDKNGTPPCLMRAKDISDTCLAALATQRLDAIERYRAAYDSEPPLDVWAKQFELDTDVAELMKVVEEKRKADATKAVADAKVATDKAVADKATADAKKIADRKKALEDARKSMLEADAPAPDAPTTPAPTPNALRKPVPAHVPSTPTSSEK